MHDTRFDKRWRHTRITVIGAGRAGSFACLALGMAGIQRIRAVDHDHLDPERNLGVQFYRPADVRARRSKVEALRDLLGELCPVLAIDAVNAEFPDARAAPAGPVVLMAVDTMAARLRSAIVLAADDTVAYLVDLRLGGSVLRCHSCTGHEEIAGWRDRLHSDEDSWGAACGDSPDPHVAVAAAAVAVASIRAFVRGVPYPRQVVLDVGAEPCLLTPSPAA